MHKLLVLCLLLAPHLAVASLPWIKPEDAGFSREGLARVDALIEASVANGFPGAVLAITRHGALVKLTAYGYAKVQDEKGKLDSPQPMRNDTLFDLASNTKIWATTWAIQHLVWQGKIDLDAPLQQYLPGFLDAMDDQVKGKDKITVVQVLRHLSGEIANPLYYDRTWSETLFSQRRNSTYHKLLATPLISLPGEKNVYSDLGFMLLGMLVETVTGMTLDQYVEQTFYALLDVRVLFAPLRGHPRLHRISAENIAATEIHGNTRDGNVFFENIRAYTLQGEVHDEKAFYSLQEIAGHAGLFADAEGLSILQQVMLGNGCYQSQCFFDQEIINRFTAPDFEHDPSFGLGWRLNIGNGPYKPAKFFGRYASEKAFGHTGWTGIATLVDPEYALGIVFLSNKKHTPVINATVDSNHFVGDTFPISDYRQVIEAVYQAMGLVDENP